MTSKIYTKTGDTGDTRLGDGSATHKDSLRIEAIGTLDELNALLGLVAAKSEGHTKTELLAVLQNSLFELGAELAAPGKERISTDDVYFLEQAIDRIDEQLPALTNFILPGGNEAGAICHLARTLCRRAERTLFRLDRHEKVNSDSLKYVNRLSDLLFVLARLLVLKDGGEEVLWKGS